MRRLSALYIWTGGYDKTREILPALLKDVIEEVLSGKGYMNYKSLLQEYFNQQGVYDIRYVVYKEEGPQHDKVFHVKLYQGKKEISTGAGKSKKQAEQQAAQAAVDILNIKFE